MQRSARITRVAGLALLSILWMALVGLPALAQQEPGPGPTPSPGDDQSLDELLQEISETSPQAAIGRVIGIICPQGNLQSDLQERCNDMAANARENPAAVRAALQAAAPEENAAVGSTLVDGSVQQIDRVGQRMESVRAGARGGASFQLALVPASVSGLPLRGFAGGMPRGSGFTGLGLSGSSFAPSEFGLDGPGLNAWGDRETGATQSLLADPFGSLLYAQTEGQGGGGTNSYDADLSAWGFFFSGTLQSAERDSTDRETGFDLDGYGFTAGFDRSGARSTYGVSLGFQSEESDLKADSGDIERESLEAAVHASYFPSERWFLDLVAGAGRGDLQQDRRIAYVLAGVPIDQTASGDTDFDQRFANVALGWDLGGGAEAEPSPWSVSPEIRVEWLEVDVNAFSEVMSDPLGPGNGLGFVVDAQSFTSLTSNLGLQISRAHSTSWGVLQTTVSGEWVHEFENGVELLTGRFLGDPNQVSYVLSSDEAVEDYARVGASLVAVTAGGGSFFVQVQHLLAYDDLESTSLGLGGRLEF